VSISSRWAKASQEERDKILAEEKKKSPLQHLIDLHLKEDSKGNLETQIGGLRPSDSALLSI
jgi:hypothetical protein